MTHHPFFASAAATSPRSLPALRRHALATAWPNRINRPAPSTTSTTHIFLHDRFDRRPLDMLKHPLRVPIIACRHRSSIDPPLLRFAAPATLTGCARAVRDGRSPDDPASAFHLRAGPRAFSHAPAGQDVSRSPLRFSAFSGFIAMKLAWRTLIGSERWNRIRRSRGASPQWVRTRPCRRVDDLLLWPLASSIACAGEIGESDPQRHPPDRHTGRPKIT